jgi:diguanylate cyclase (GGDEF)-like protein
MTDTLDTAQPTPLAGNVSPAGSSAALRQQDPASIRFAVIAAGEATYHWNLESDALSWSAMADAVLRRSPQSLSTGKHFAALLDPENLTSRYDTIINSTGEDQGDGVPYTIEYQLRGDPTSGLPPMWVEDRGRWFSDKNGRPREAVGLVRQINDRHSRDQKLSELSHTDPLTGMMNRARLDEALEEAIGEAKSNESSCAFAVATIRNLDVVNEAYGFEVADEVIAALAQRLRAVMRTGDGIARYSGGKFGFILNNCSATELPIAIERFLNAARDSVIETAHGPVWALLSVGAVLLPVHAETAAGARALAEESLSAALRMSSDSFVVHLPSEKVNTARLVNTRCAAEIVECLKANKFHLAYQPLVDATTGAVACHEALLRMRDGSGEMVTAGHLVPVAERLGLIRLVDRAVVQLALETLHRHAEACLSINLSATTANDPRWNCQIIEMIEMAGDVAQRLTVEITETTALTDLTSALAFLERLRSTGCCVAIDDFGAGFTSFRNLRDLPIDVIKLDGSYCRNLVKDSENVYFARTLIEMAHHFGIRTVAEWVETESDAEILRSLGVDFLQGNYLGAPDTEAPWTETAASAFSFNDAPQADMADEADVPAVSADAHEDPALRFETVILDDDQLAVSESSGGENVDGAQFDLTSADDQVPVGVSAAPAAIEVTQVAEDAPDGLTCDAATALPAADMFPATVDETVVAASDGMNDGLIPVIPAEAAETAPEAAADQALTSENEPTSDLDEEVDQSLSRLRAALDILSQQLAAPATEEPAEDKSGGDMRLAG